MFESQPEQLRKLRRQDSNRRAYQKSRENQEHVLMRLEKGDLSMLDAASISLGLSRSAFLRMFMGPMLGAVSAHIPAIEAAQAARGQSFAQFLDSSIRASLAAAPPMPNPLGASQEFDALFSTSDGGV